MNMMLAVAAGGALGAIARYWMIGLVDSWAGHALPWGTLGVNVLGAFGLGVMIELLALAWSPSPQLSAMIMVGVVGAFTTFSAFTVELFLMLERGEFVHAALYSTGSVLLSLGGLFAGLRLTRLVLL